MKKIGHFILAAAMTALIFTSCEKSGGGLLSKSPEIAPQFEAEMKIQSGELELSADVKRYGTEFWEMSVTAPESMAGLSVSMNSEGVIAGYDGLSLSVPAEDIRDGAVFSMLFKAFDNAVSVGKLSCNESEEGFTYEGEFSDCVYMLSFSPDSMNPTLLEIPAMGFCAEIVNYDVISQKSGLDNSTEQSSETN